MTSEDAQLTRDVVAELEEVMKSDSRVTLRKLQPPLLRACAESMAPGAKSLDLALDKLLTTGIQELEHGPERRALAQLFLGENQWLPLSQRGRAAASELGLSYDALRRRNKHGHRRIDTLLTRLALAIIQHADLETLLMVGPSPLLQTPDVGDIANKRASIFFSYSRHDDEHEGGLISALRESLISEFRFQTGQEIFVFLDKSSIDHGENWRRKLEKGIDNTSFLLVFLTPSYLQSASCRDELQRFLKREEERQRDDLVLPVYYATVREDTDDPLARALLERQYVDWRDLRFETFDSTPVRMAVANLAASIANAISRTSEVRKVAIPDVKTEELGLLELVTQMEMSLPRVVSGLVTMASEQEGITEETRLATAEAERLNRLGRGSAARLVVARRLSSKLGPYADRLENNAQAIRADLVTVDRGIKAIAEALPTSTEEGIEETVESMTSALQEALLSGDQAAAAVQTLSDTYADTARIASTLRPVLNRLIAGVTVIAECPNYFSAWKELLQNALSSRRTAPV